MWIHNNQSTCIYYPNVSCGILKTNLLLLLAFDSFLNEHHQAGLEDEYQGQQVNTFLDLSELIECVQPVHVTVHLQITNVQVDVLWTVDNSYA